jgi:hypothetical protein
MSLHSFGPDPVSGRDPLSRTDSPSPPTRLRALGSALLAGALAALSLPAAPPARAAVIQSAQVRRLIDGREVFIDGRTARPGNVARSGQQLRTGRSRAELLFDGRTVGFMGRSSVLNVGSQCLRLDRGAVLMSGPQKTCLGSKVLGVRATTTIVSTDSEGFYNVAVLEGTAYVDDPGGYEEQRLQSTPGDGTTPSPAGETPRSSLQVADGDLLAQRSEPSERSQDPPGRPPGSSIPVVDGDPTGRTTYICACEVARFDSGGGFVQQGVLGRREFLALLNRFTDDQLELPPGVPELIQASIERCR